MRQLVLLVAIALAGCGDYGTFSLPAPPPGPDIRFEWQIRPDPVLTRGPQPWESVDVLNPSVVPFHGALWNLYSGFDGSTWHTGTATATDPWHWTRQGVVISPRQPWEGKYIAANGSAMVRDGQLHYWYQAGNPPRIGLATSPDGRRWTRQSAPVLGTGPVGSWDERGVGDPNVVEAGGHLYVWFVGMDRARRQRLGLATSRDGLHWTKLRSNPVLELGEDGAFDENGLGEPAVWASNGHYWMLYTGRDRTERRRIGLAESEDGVTWHRSSRVPVFEGGEPWNRQVVCDPTVLPAEGGLHVWFGGGDAARPDERIDGQIGYAFLRMVLR